MARNFLIFHIAILALSTFFVQQTQTRGLHLKPGANFEENNIIHSSLHNDKLMVILLDGFRWNYFEAQKDRLPGFTQFLRKGVQATFVNPVIPSVSFPNWHSLSTGLYPESHGILGNDMLNLSRVLENHGQSTDQAVFSLSNLGSTFQPSWWQFAEPIWTTADRYGRKTFCWLWSRCDVQVPGKSGSLGEIPYSPDPENTGFFPAGLDQGLQTMKVGLERGLEKLNGDSDLALIYVEYADAVGHKFGPDSVEMRQAVLDMDAVFSQFLHKLHNQYGKLSQKLNIIVTSDHGMTSIGRKSGTQYVVLEDYVQLRDVAAFVPSRNFVGLVPAPGRAESLYWSLIGIRGVDVFLWSQIPEEWHYKNNPLVLPFLVSARPGYAIVTADERIPGEEGQHGWMPQNAEDMRSIFYASGPAFRKNVIIPPIELVDIYQIYPHLLNFPPQPHNGTWSHVRNIFV